MVLLLSGIPGRKIIGLWIGPKEVFRLYMLTGRSGKMFGKSFGKMFGKVMGVFNLRQGIFTIFFFDPVSFHAGLVLPRIMGR